MTYLLKYYVSAFTKTMLDQPLPIRYNFTQCSKVIFYTLYKTIACFSHQCIATAYYKQLLTHSTRPWFVSRSSAHLNTFGR